MVKNALAVVLISSLALQGCAGRTPNPVSAQQYGDERKSCAALQKEMAFVEDEIGRLLPKSDKTGQNVALGVAGAFFLVPWFFMDFSKAEQVEIDAFRRRYNQLALLASENKCGFDAKPIPEFTGARPAEPDPGSLEYRYTRPRSAP